MNDRSRVDGWLLINKPRAMSSSRVVEKVKKLLGKVSKVGHAGTLDPLAEGLLPIAIGEATKTVQYLLNSIKEYEFSISWGEERDTGDAEGQVINRCDSRPNFDDMTNIIDKFLGDITQIPPIYSAVKIGGRAAYKRARAGEEIVLPSRNVHIYEMSILDNDLENNYTMYNTICSKGTYIRSLAVDMARMLGAYGYVSYLKRKKVGNLSINDAISLDKLDDIVHNGELDTYLHPVNYPLGDIPVVDVDAEQAMKLRNGLRISLSHTGQIHKQNIQIIHKGALQAIAELDEHSCKALRVFNL